MEDKELIKTMLLSVGVSEREATRVAYLPGITSFEQAQSYIESNSGKTTSQMSGNLKIGDESDSDFDDTCFADDYEEYDDFGLDDSDEADPKDTEHIRLVKWKKEEVHSYDELLDKIIASIGDTSEILGVSKSHASHLLRKFKWNQEQLQERYFENAEQLIATLPAEENVPKGQYTGTCAICGCDYEANEIKSLDCNHCFCTYCWKDYIEVQIANGKADQIQCMQHKCSELALDPSWLREVVTAEMLGKFVKFWVNLYVELNPIWKRCPRAGCQCLILTDGSAQTIRCKCGYLTCPSCPLEAHEPATCEELKMWENKTRKDMESTYEWIKFNTQDCPNCKWPIQKNEGCNHMTCMKCHCEFCWVCRTLTTNHGHCGNAVPPKYQSKEMGGDTRRNLEKFDNFFVKFREHNRSDEIERTLRENIREYQFVMNSKAVNMRLVELVEEAMENLLECRRILKYTYVHSFYLKTVVEKQFFKFLQDDCEKSTELLSQALSVDSLEMDIDDIRAKSNVAATRIMNLIDQVGLGLVDDSILKAAAEKERQQKRVEEQKRQSARPSAAASRVAAARKAAVRRPAPKPAATTRAAPAAKPAARPAVKRPAATTTARKPAVPTTRALKKK